MKTILLIEDNKYILENLTEYLEMEGYNIIAANNGKTGLEFTAEFMPDLVVCDVCMPVMDGYQVLELFLATDKIYEIPFIFSSSMSEKVNRTEAMKLGADDYIIKPFEPEALVKMAKAWIQSGSRRLLHIF